MRNLFGGDPYFNNVVLQLPLRRSATETQQIPVRTITASGTQFSQVRAIFFDGDNDWLQTDTSADFNPIGTWTAECWYYAITTTSVPYILSVYQNSVTRWAIQVSNDRVSGGLFVANGTGNVYTLDLSNQSLTGWQHLAITRNAQTSICTVFHNGKIVYRGTPSPDFGNANGYMEIGAAAFNSSNELNGYIVDVRYTKNIVRYKEQFSPGKLFNLTVEHPIYGNPQEFRLPTHGVAALNHRTPVALSEAKRPPLLARMTEHGGDPYFNNVVLQLPLRSHMRDESKNLNTVTVNGNTQLLNDATFFDGNRDYLGVPSSSLPSGTETFTIEVWVNISNLANTTTILRGGTGSLEINVQTSGAVVVDVAGYGNIITSSTGAVSALKWTHIALCRVGTVVTLFVNGKEAGKASSISNLTTISEIFYNSYSSTYDFRGYARDFRVTKGIARYTSNFVPPTSLPTHGVAAAFASRVPTYMKSEYKNTPINKTKKYIGGVIEPPLRSDIIAVTYGNTIIGGLDSSYTTSRNKIGISNSIESTNFSSVQVNSNATLVPANLHIPSSSIQYATIIAEVNCTNRTTPQYQRFGTLGNEGLVLRGQNGDIHIYGYVSGVLREYVYNGGYTLGRHIYAGVYNGTQFKLYKDGSFLADSNTYTGTLSNASTFYLPGSPTGGEYVAGSVLRTACFNRALSLTEINNWAYGQDAQRLFTSTNNIVRTTTVVEPLPTVKVFYINRDLITPIKDIYANKITHHINSESGTIKDIKGNSITINNATVNNTIKPFGKSSMYFNGNANVNFPGFNFWGNEYTIDGYMYCIAGSGSVINSSGIVCEGQYYWGLGVNSSNQLNLYYWTGVQNNINGGSIPTSKWVHFAISYSSGIISVWIDGVRKIYSSISPNPASGSIYIGGWNSYANAFNGYIKNVRITKAIRYRGFFITSPTYKELMLR